MHYLHKLAMCYTCNIGCTGVENHSTRTVDEIRRCHLEKWRSVRPAQPNREQRVPARKHHGPGTRVINPQLRRGPRFAMHAPRHKGGGSPRAARARADLVARRIPLYLAPEGSVTSRRSDPPEMQKRQHTQTLLCVEGAARRVLRTVHAAIG